MVDLSLNRSVQELSKYFRLYSLEELIDESLKKNSSLIDSQAAQSIELQNANSELYSKLLTILVETQKGSLMSNELVREIENINTQFEQIDGIQNVYDETVIPYYENISFTNLPNISEIIGHPEVDSNINQTPEFPTKESPSISVYQIKTVRINPTNKSTNAVSIFMNTIPSIEWSRAVPFLNVSFQLARPNISNNRIASLSLLKFLEGSKQVSELQAADLILAGATSNNLDPNASGSSGIEIFTAPQTLVNANSENDIAFRAAPIFDVFRPFATLKSFSVEVVPAPGIMSYRTGKLSFTIHDRARLHEIADFIKPDQYNTAEIMIEYGWSHPELNGAQGSAFGEFLNSMKVKEKYMVKNNSFAVKPNGEVSVELELYTKGASDMTTNRVSTDGNVVKVQEEIQRLQDRIKSLRLRVFKQDAKYTKEVRGAQILSSASDGNSDLLLSRALKTELRKSLSSLGKKGLGDDAKELRKALVELYGTKGDDGAAKDLKDSIAAAINRKIEMIKGKQKTSDPFLYADLPADQRTISSINQKNTDKDYVSLAKLFLLFVAEPLAETNRFDDIQLLFYTFNKNAGEIHSRNIGSFKIDIESFRKRYKKVTMLQRTADLNLRDFVDFVSNTFVDDASSVNYGMRELYSYEPDKESGSRLRVKKKFREQTILNSEIENLMKKAGVADGKFIIPILDIFVECVPAVINEQNIQQDDINSKTILRIHVFDKAASAYSTQGELLAATRDDMITTVGNVPIVDQDTPATSKQKEEASKIISEAESRNLIEEFPPGSKIYQIKGGLVELKEFIANTMPSIIFGVQNSAVFDFGAKSMQDDNLSTINMIRSGDAGPLTPNGVNNGIPMQLMPSQMELNCRGCPIVEYAQSYFIDMGTNTSLDNIYTSIGISHTMDGAGSFRTSIKLTPIDSLGQYRSLINKIRQAIQITGEFIDEDDGIQILE